MGRLRMAQGGWWVRYLHLYLLIQCEYAQSVSLNLITWSHIPPKNIPSISICFFDQTQKLCPGSDRHNLQMRSGHVSRLGMAQGGWWVRYLHLYLLIQCEYAQSGNLNPIIWSKIPPQIFPQFQCIFLLTKSKSFARDQIVTISKWEAAIWAISGWLREGEGWDICIYIH